MVYHFGNLKDDFTKVFSQKGMLFLDVNSMQSVVYGAIVTIIMNWH